MFNSDKIYCLLMGNSLQSCKNDTIHMEKIFKCYNSDIEIFTDCFPKKQILDFLNSKKITSKDILLIHFSGHGRLIYKNINNKLQPISNWVNPDNSLVYSYEIDHILSNLNCKIILISDSCHSEKFGELYYGKTPFLFIGSSKINDVSTEYSNFSKEKTGIIVCLLKYIHQNHSLNNLTYSKMMNLINNFFKKKYLKSKPVIKIVNM